MFLCWRCTGEGSSWVINQAYFAKFAYLSFFLYFNDIFSMFCIFMFRYQAILSMISDTILDTICMYLQHSLWVRGLHYIGTNRYRTQYYTRFRPPKLGQNQNTPILNRDKQILGTTSNNDIDKECISKLLHTSALCSNFTSSPRCSS